MAVNNSNGAVKKRLLAGTLALAVSLTVVAGVSAADNNGLVAYYEFDEVKGGTVPDLSGNNRDARLVDGAKLSAGKFGQAVELDGQGAYVQLPDKVIFGDEFTYSGWVYWNGGTRAQRIIDFGTDSETSFLTITPKGVGDVIRMLVREQTPADAIVGKNAITEQQWTHVAAVIKGTTAKLYVNGSLVGTNDSLVNTVSKTAGPNNDLGRSKLSNEPFYGGKFDRVAIYAKALSDADIKALAGGKAPLEAARTSATQGQGQQTPATEPAAPSKPAVPSKPKADTAAAQFELLKQQGIFQGYADGTAGLDKEMTRAEFATVLVRLLKLAPQSGKSSYADTASHWAHKEGSIEAVTGAKLMEGTTPGTFEPDGKMTIEQTAAVLVRAMKLETASGSSVQGKASDWAKPYVEAAVQAGLIAEQPDYTPNAKRGLLVAAVYTSQN